MSKLISDIDAAHMKRIFEIMQQDTEIFRKYSNPEIEEMLQLFKCLTFKK